MRLLLSLIAAAALVAQPVRNRHVLIISIDGLAARDFHDRNIPLPTLRRLAEKGVAAESLQVVNPSVTWPNHTTIVTGVSPAMHGLLFNGMPVKGKPGEPVRVEPWRDKAELVQAATLYDVAHRAGLTTAEVDWVAILNAPTITWSFSERPGATDRLVVEMIRAGVIAESDVQNFAKAPIVFRDEIWTRAGEYLIRKHKPNLLLFHLLTTDSAQHQYGARSLGGNAALALADARVRRLLDALEDANIADRTTVFIVSDHGFKTYGHLIHASALLKRESIEGVTVIPEGGTAMVYITRPEQRAELVPKLRQQFSAVPGITQVLAPEDFDRAGYPPASNERMSDLVLVAQDGYAFGSATEGEVVRAVPAGATPGAHGYLRTDPDMNATLIISGAGIRPGSKLGHVSNLDIAPTAARILGLDLGKVEGKPLTGVLVPALR